MAGGSEDQAPLSLRPPLSVRPCGTAASMAERIPARLSGRCSARIEVRTAIMPQPMSTPTAAGMIAPTVGITEPTVAPMPQCTSGMTAMWLWMKGRAATLRSCFIADSSIGTPLVQALIGAPPLSICSNPLMGFSFSRFRFSLRRPSWRHGRKRPFRYEEPLRPGQEGFVRTVLEVSAPDHEPSPAHARKPSVSTWRSSRLAAVLKVGALWAMVLVLKGAGG